MARTKIQVEFHTSFFKKTKGNVGKLRDNVRYYSEALARYGKGVAQSEVPRDTGRMHDFIKATPENSGKNRSVWIVEAMNPVVGGGTDYRGGGEEPSTNAKYNTRGTFDLVKWAHNSGFASSHFKSGNPRFMYRAKGEMMKLRNQWVKDGTFKKGIIK